MYERLNRSTETAVGCRVTSPLSRKWGTRIFGAMTFTKCRCFKAEQTEEAWTWLTEN